MPWICPELPTNELSSLNARFPVNDDIDLFTAGENLIFHMNGSFYFQRIVDSISNTVEQDLKGGRNYLCTAYEVLKEGADIIPTLLEQFQERHGVAMTSLIVPFKITFKGMEYALLKLPTMLVRHLMRGRGGVLKTTVSGPVSSLRCIPMLALYGNLPKEEGALHKTVFATTYGEGQHAEALHIHYLLLQDVVNHPSLGIMVSGVGQWDASP
jgi:hypothetical protein